MSAPLPGSHDPWIGRTLAGRYRVVRPLGEGGIGAVYVAEHLSLGRHVALKVLHPHFASTPALRTRFEREARALSRLSHPNVVTVVDFGAEDSALYLVMELVEAETLTERLRREPPDVRTSLAIMRQILSALAYAHGLGIVHRDLKPGNVLVRRLPDGVEHVTVLDFGLAKFLDDETSAALTKQGAVLGTPAYMAPEQSMGDRATAPADVYAATLILFELLTGRRPYPSRDPGEIFKAHMFAPIPTLAEVRPDLMASPELEAIVRRGLDKKASARFPDAKAMLEAFDSLPELLRATNVPRGKTAPELTAPVASVATPGASNPMSFVLGAPVEPDAMAPGVASMATMAVPTAHDLPGNVARVSAPLATQVPAFAAAPAPMVAPTTSPSLATTSAGPTKIDRKILVAAAIAFVVTIVGILGAIALMKSFGDEPAPSTTTPTIPVVLPTPGVGSTPIPQASSGRVTARNPWSESVPAEIKSLYDRIERGENPSRIALMSLYRYDAARPGESRGHLLLAHTYVNRGWQSDALDAYRDAYHADPSSRGDPRMLADLVQLAERTDTHRRAKDYLVTWFGPEALPAVTARLAQATDPEKRERLESVGAALAHAR